MKVFVALSALVSLFSSAFCFVFSSESPSGVESLAFGESIFSSSSGACTFMPFFSSLRVQVEFRKPGESVFFAIREDSSFFSIMSSADLEHFTRRIAQEMGHPGETSTLLPICRKLAASGREQMTVVNETFFPSPKLSEKDIAVWMAKDRENDALAAAMIQQSANPVVIDQVARSIWKHSRSMKVDPFLIAAIAIKESHCTPNLISGAGAAGIMQVHVPAHIDRLRQENKKLASRITDPRKDKNSLMLDVDFSIRNGTDIIKNYIRSYGVNRGLMAYLGKRDASDGPYARSVLQIKKNIERSYKVELLKIQQENKLIRPSRDVWALAPSLVFSL